MIELSLNRNVLAHVDAETAAQAGGAFSNINKMQSSELNSRLKSRWKGLSADMHDGKKREANNETADNTRMNFHNSSSQIDHGGKNMLSNGRAQCTATQFRSIVGQPLSDSKTESYWKRLGEQGENEIGLR